MSEPRKIVPSERVFDWGAWNSTTGVQLRDGELCLCDFGGRPADDNQREIMRKARVTRYNGTLTRGGQKRMTRAITLLNQSTKTQYILNPVTGRYFFHRLSFITLTVPGDELVSHRKLYEKCLKPFLYYLRQKKHGRRYIWKAELQKRGQLHYHIITPAFVDHRELRKKWNKLLSDAGLMRSFVKKHKHLNPNSTDIHERKKNSRYLIKELGKATDAQILRERVLLEKQLNAGEISHEDYCELCAQLNDAQAQIDGKVWDCSAGLNEKYFTIMMSDRLDAALRLYCNEHKEKVMYAERFALVQLDVFHPPPGLDVLKDCFRGFNAYMHFVRSGGKRYLKELLN